MISPLLSDSSSWTPASVNWPKYSKDFSTKAKSLLDLTSIFKWFIKGAILSSFWRIKGPEAPAAKLIWLRRGSECSDWSLFKATEIVPESILNNSMLRHSSDSMDDTELMMDIKQILGLSISFGNTQNWGNSCGIWKHKGLKVSKIHWNGFDRQWD